MSLDGLSAISESISFTEELMENKNPDMLKLSCTVLELRLHFGLCVNWCKHYDKVSR